MDGTEHNTEGETERAIVEVIPLGRVDAVACEVAAANIQSILGLSSRKGADWPIPSMPTCRPAINMTPVRSSRLWPGI